jgi:hypothetical protein
VKPRNREVNIFNMSVLDLLTGALGAFCFLTLALFPSYYLTHKPSAADEESAAQRERFAKQFGKTKQGIPPFSLAEIYASDNLGNACGVFKLDDMQAPRGNKSFRQLPFAAGTGAIGYQRFIYLFLFDSGTYHLTITAYGANSPCRLGYRQHTPQGSLGMTTELTDSPVRYPFNFEVKPQQLITSILPH